MADGSLSYVPGGYVTAGRRLGLSADDVQATLWLATHTDYYRGRRGPSSRDPLMAALRKHAAIERGSYIVLSPDQLCDSDSEVDLDDVGDVGPDHACDHETWVDHLTDLIAGVPRRRKGTRPRCERRAEEDRRKARENHQLWFCGAGWRMDAANDDDDGTGEAE